MQETKSVYIMSVEAKDLWLSNHLKVPQPNGYNIYDKNGQLNLKKFSGSFSYSIELDKLKKVYYSVYRRKNIILTRGNKEYVKSIINVDFTYSVKEYNPTSYFTKDTNGKKIVGTAYVKTGYNINDITFDNGAAIIDNELVGIITGVPIDNPIPTEMYGTNFTYCDGQYSLTSNRTLVNIEELRKWIYSDGFICDGIHYIRYKRSNGSSRIGKCLFIDEKLYPQIYKWQCCGIDPYSSESFDLAAFEAYIGLTMSSTIDSIEIYPENILVIDDYESTFKENMIVTRDVDGHLKSQKELYEVHNNIWDGQSLLDVSLFENFQDRGMLLLRNRFFKSCCFNTNIQQWFKDHNITSISQLNGYTLASNVEDIKLITTPSSIKYLKFGTLRQWLNKISPIFGVVKHEKPTHNLGGLLVYTHYQLINTLQLSESDVSELIKPTLSLIDKLYNDPAVMRMYINFKQDNKFQRNFASKNDAVINMLGITDKFAETKTYEDFKYDLIRSIKNDMKRGRILVKGNYSVLFGNPIEMLQSSINIFDGTSQLGVGNIYSKNFESNKTILGSRSPHVCASNIYLATNIYNSEIEKYFNLSKQIVAVNSINESLLDRFSGCDFDSDTCLLTDNPILIDAAKKNYDRFLVPTNAVKAKKTKRKYTPEELADLDYKTSSNKIGEDINLAQVLTTQMWNRIYNGEKFEDIEDLYNDIVTLDVLSGLEIDKAKKEFEIDTGTEIKIIREKRTLKANDGRTILPKFLGFIAKKKGYYNKDKKDYSYQKSSMEYVQRVVNRIRYKRSDKYTTLSELLNVEETNPVNANYKQRKQIIQKLRECKSEILQLFNSDNTFEPSQKEAILSDIIKERDKYINSMKINRSTVRLLIQSVDKNEYSDCKKDLFDTLFSPRVSALYDAIESIKEPITLIEEDINGNIEIFGVHYRHITK